MPRRFRAAFAVALAGALWASAPAAQVQRFHASWEASRWRVDARPGTCALVHEIPHFGEARFEQQSGRRLAFSLQVEQAPVREQTARLVSEPPPWKHRVTAYPLGDFQLRSGKTPMQLPRDQALRIYHELEQGMRPVIEFSDWKGGRDQVEVSLSPVRFREALSSFAKCTAGLLHLDFEPLAEKKVFFRTNSYRLSRTARSVLDKAAAAWRKRHDVRFVLGGHADERGTPDYNMALSKKRVAMVRRYLRARGVPAGAIDSRYFGETMPEAGRNTKAARARNRQVTIWLAGK